MDFVALRGLVEAALLPEWRRERVDCFVAMLRGVFETQSVNTYRLAQRMGGGVRKEDVQFESQAQRLRRFLADQKFDWSVIGKLLLQVAGAASDEKLVVAVDRTNWDFGKTAINFLVISVRVFGVGVPVVWTQLNKQGNSRTKERVDLLERFLDIVPAERIGVFLADREFIGKTWFKTLQALNIPYAIRVRNNQFITRPDGQKSKCSELAKTLKPDEEAFYPEVMLDGVPCSLALKQRDQKNKKDLLAVIAFGLSKPETALEMYRLRWSIELCFACMKTKGFNIEDTHLRHPDRLEKIFALAALAAAAALRASTTSTTSKRKKSMASLPDLPSCVALITS